MMKNKITIFLFITFISGCKEPVKTHYNLVPIVTDTEETDTCSWTLHMDRYDSVLLVGYEIGNGEERFEMIDSVHYLQHDYRVPDHPQPVSWNNHSQWYIKDMSWGIGIGRPTIYITKDGLIHIP